MFEKIGLRHTPWWVRVYMVLVSVFLVLVLVSAMPGLDSVAGLATEGLQTTLAALLGALSASAQKSKPMPRQ